MSIQITKDLIKDKISLLNYLLPNPPVPVDELYSIPKHLLTKIIESDYSDVSIQSVADHIGYFLGIIESVKVHVYREMSEFMLRIQNDNRDQNVGLYTVTSSGRTREIHIIKKYKFDVFNILAILAHESTHNYLYKHKVSENDNYLNEILTDLSCVYLGLGELLYDGYNQIETSFHQEKDLFGTVQNIYNSIKIGYIDRNHIEYAMFYSAISRGKKYLGRKLPLFERYSIRKSIKKST